LRAPPPPPPPPPPFWGGAARGVRAGARRGAALTVVRRARAALAELGLQPPPNLISLEETIVA